MIKDLFNKLEQQYLFDKKHNTIFIVIEAIAGIVAGIFIKSVVSSFNFRDLILGILFTALFLYLVFRRASMQTNFSFALLRVPTQLP